MKNSLLLCAICAVVAHTLFVGQAFAVDRSVSSIVSGLSGTPLAFTKNMGQWPDSILFRASSGGTTMWFTRNGVYYQFTRRILTADSSARETDVTAGRMRLLRRGFRRDSIETMMVKASFVGCNPNSKLTGDSLLQYTSNYFLGKDPNRWRGEVPSYRSIICKNIYPGVDLKYRLHDTRMLCDFIVSPGADLASVVTSYQGARLKSAADSGFVLLSQVGRQTAFFSPKGRSLQSASLRNEGVVRQLSDSTLGLMASGEPGKQSADTISIEVSFSTYLGGSGYEYTHAVTVDEDGNVYVTGQTSSADFPTVHAFQDSLNEWGGYDAFVSKFSSSGSALLFSTYVGGRSFDWGAGLAVDANHYVYITGGTQSFDFPTVSAFQDSAHDQTNGFVAKLSPSGSALIYSTYLGGSASPAQDQDSGRIPIEYGTSITIDESGSAFVTGFTEDSDFPTFNAIDWTLRGTRDAFVTKLSPSGRTLTYSTYLGGDGVDEGYDIALDANGNAYVVGATTSPNFPTTTPYDGTFDGIEDAFVCKLSPLGNSLLYSTFLGGKYSDVGTGIALDENGDVYVTGSTVSPDFPVRNALQPTFHGGDTADVFVSRLSPSIGGDRSLVYSTFLGGIGGDWGEAIAVDKSGNVYVTGSTNSLDFPIVGNFSGSVSGGRDAFLSLLSPSGSELLGSMLLGGKSDDVGTALKLDADGHAYVVGYTESSDFPVKQAFDSTFGGVRDAFLAKVRFANTYPGTNLMYAPMPGVELTFDSVISPGLTSACTVSMGPTPPGNLGVVPLGQPRYYSIKTSAAFLGTVQICITYDDTSVIQDETDLQLMHYGSSGWTNITSALDTSSNRICGLTDSLSYFAVMGPCCHGLRGNVNENGITDLADLTAMVSYLTGGGYILPCPAAANINGQGIIDLVDLSALVSYLTGGGFVLPNCPIGLSTSSQPTQPKTAASAQKKSSQ